MKLVFHEADAFVALHTEFGYTAIVKSCGLEFDNDEWYFYVHLGPLVIWYSKNQTFKPRL